MADSVDEEIQALEVKVLQLKREYDQYFLGTRPREPVLLAGEVRKSIAKLSSTAIKNTALRFKFSSVCSRYQAFNRQWIENLRKMDDGSYARHRFKADLHGRAASGEDDGTSPAPEGARADDPALFASYVDARRACGQEVEHLSPAKLKAILSKQETALRARYEDAEIRFRVVVEDGKAKLKVARIDR